MAADGEASGGAEGVKGRAKPSRRLPEAPAEQKPGAGRSRWLKGWRVAGLSALVGALAAGAVAARTMIVRAGENDRAQRAPEEVARNQCLEPLAEDARSADEASCDGRTTDWAQKEQNARKVRACVDNECVIEQYPRAIRVVNVIDKLTFGEIVGEWQAYKTKGAPGRGGEGAADTLVEQFAQLYLQDMLPCQSDVVRKLMTELSGELQSCHSGERQECRLAELRDTAGVLVKQLAFELAGAQGGEAAP